MRVTVHYRAQARQAAGLASESVEVDAACSIEDLARLLAARRGEGLRGLLFGDDGAIRGNVLFIVGGEQVPKAGGATLRDGDTVTILPPMAGG